MKIWFNHWFSTVYHLINLIKKGSPDKFTFVGTNERETAVYKRACDEWYIEPQGLSDDEYVQYCLDFCKEHDIKIFAPRKKSVAISQKYSEFEKIGVLLLLDNAYESMLMLDDKAKTYDYFNSIIPDYIPEYRVAKSLEEFNSAYIYLSERYPRVCYKLIEDEGARSFRVIDNRIEGAKALLEKPGTKVTIESAQKILSTYNFEVPMLLMPFLSGVEVSVDCLATSSGNIIIPRFKTNKRYSEIIFDEKIMSVCDAIMNDLGFITPMNIQFKYESDHCYLLEINTRMSGGLQLSCEASEINLPDIAVNALIGVNKSWEYPNIKSQKVVHIETPIRLY